MKEDLKLSENQRLRLEKQILTQQISFDNEQRIRDSHFSRELKLKSEEVAGLDDRLHTQQTRYEEKLEQYRDRLKCVEKTVYERVEREYSQLLAQKDTLISDQSQRLAALEDELVMMRRELDEERDLRLLDRDAEAVRERKRAVADREQMAVSAREEGEREMRRYKERVQQDLEFREAQLEARYVQMTKQKEIDMEIDKQQIEDQQA